jgi:hypothetical protein
MKLVVSAVLLGVARAAGPWQRGTGNVAVTVSPTFSSYSINFMGAGATVIPGNLSVMCRDARLHLGVGLVPATTAAAVQTSGTDAALGPYDEIAQRFVSAQGANCGDVVGKGF